MEQIILDPLRPPQRNDMLHMAEWKEAEFSPWHLSPQCFLLVLEGLVVPVEQESRIMAEAKMWDELLPWVPEERRITWQQISALLWGCLPSLGWMAARVGIVKASGEFLPHIDTTAHKRNLETDNGTNDYIKHAWGDVLSMRTYTLGNEMGEYMKELKTLMNCPCAMRTV